MALQHCIAHKRRIQKCINKQSRHSNVRIDPPEGSRRTYTQLSSVTQNHFHFDGARVCALALTYIIHRPSSQLSGSLRYTINRIRSFYVVAHYANEEGVQNLLQRP